jgi:hypothetical protein
MNASIKKILRLARKRIELSKHFSTIPQGKLLDMIEQNKTQELTEILQRPLMLLEQAMVLDYLLIYNNVKDNLNEVSDFQPQPPNSAHPPSPNK